MNPYADSARKRHLEWVCAQGLVRSEAGLIEYESWDLPQAAARTYPYSSAEDIYMLMNWFSLAFLFDDQVDTHSPGVVRRVAAVAEEMITIPFRPAGSAPDVVCPITLAWSQIWDWLSDGMSEAWRNRFSASWARFLAAHMHEVRLSAQGAELGLDEYTALRRITVGIHHSIDAAERSRRFEVPVRIQAHPLMRELRNAAADTIAYMNDIHSLEREERRGDSHNLVTVLRRARNCSRAEAIEQAAWMAAERLRRYEDLESRVAGLCVSLDLTAEDRDSVEMGLEGIRNWIRGNYDWALSTGRYSAVKTGAAADAERSGKGAVDDLLPSTAGAAGAGSGPGAGTASGSPAASAAESAPGPARSPGQNDDREPGRRRRHELPSTPARPDPNRLAAEHPAEPGAATRGPRRLRPLHRRGS